MSSNQLLHSRACARRDGGFTLAEILVTIVIVSIFATILFQLVRGQGNFVAIQGGRSEAQQNARGALEIIAADLRAASAQSLVDGQNNSITLNVPRAWGIVCSADLNEIQAVFPDVPELMVNTVNANTGITVDADELPQVSTFLPGTISSVTKMDLATSNCSGTNAAGAVLVYRFTGTFPQSFPHQSMFLHDRVTYDVAAGTDNMLWIRRTHGAGPQPLAGPLPAATDLRFTYFDMTPAPIAAPGTATLGLQSIGRIRVDVSARSRHKVNGLYQMERDSITVSLRN